MPAASFPPPGTKRTRIGRPFGSALGEEGVRACVEDPTSPVIAVILYNLTTVSHRPDTLPEHEPAPTISVAPNIGGTD